MCRERNLSTNRIDRSRSILGHESISPISAVVRCRAVGAAFVLNTTPEKHAQQPLSQRRHPTNIFWLVWVVRRVLFCVAGIVLAIRQRASWASSLITYKQLRQTKKNTERKETYAQCLAPSWTYFWLGLYLLHLFILLISLRYEYPPTPALSGLACGHGLHFVATS